VSINNNVRIPDFNENNANRILIDKGATGISMGKAERGTKEILMLRETESSDSVQEQLF
jgi:hypothetical protein